MRNPSFEMSVNLQSLSMKGGGEERAIIPLFETEVKKSKILNCLAKHLFLP